MATTAFKQVKNGAFSTVQAGSTIIASAVGTSITLGSGHGARFPSPGTGFWVTVWNSATYTNPADDPNMEIMTCTVRATDTLTVTRGQNGTTANASIASGARIQILLQDQQFADAHTAINTLESNYDNGVLGWTPAGVTWTYASATTFTITGDVTATYVPGLKLQLTQTTVKYFYVASSAYSSPNTTVTITGGTDYTLANAAISVPQFSRISAPSGFPQWFNYTPTWGGVTGTITGVFRFKVNERTVTLNLAPNSLGTSAGSTLTVSAPIQPATITNAIWVNGMQGFDSGAALSAASEVIVSSGSSTINCYKTMDGGTTAWAGNRVVRGNIVYEI